MNNRTTHVGAAKWKKNQATKARMRIVEEHLRLENLHDLDGILGAFGRDHQYDDEPWDDHRIGRDEVHLYYKELLAAAADFRIEVRNRPSAARIRATGEACQPLGSPSAFLCAGFSPSIPMTEF